jgi:hypothetical protein
LIFSPKNDHALAPLDRISSADLVAKLCADNDSPWAEWKRGNPITQVQLARLLKPLAAEQRHHPSYLRTQFENVWDRYL